MKEIWQITENINGEKNVYKYKTKEEAYEAFKKFFGGRDEDNSETCINRCFHEGLAIFHSIEVEKLWWRDEESLIKKECQGIEKIPKPNYCRIDDCGYCIKNFGGKKK